MSISAESLNNQARLFARNEYIFSGKAKEEESPHDQTFFGKVGYVTHFLNT
jgi:hypothetical protein